MMPGCDPIILQATSITYFHRQKNLSWQTHCPRIQQNMLHCFLLGRLINGHSHWPLSFNVDYNVHKMTKNIYIFFSFISQCFCSMMCDQGCFDYGVTSIMFLWNYCPCTQIFFTLKINIIMGQDVWDLAHSHHIQIFDAMSFCSLSYVNTMFNITGHWWTIPTLHFKVDRNS